MSYRWEPIRIGVAFTKPRGSTQRRDEYGLYAYEGTSPQYAKYEGYSEGNKQVGISLRADPPMIDFVRSHFDEVRIFQRHR